MQPIARKIGDAWYCHERENPRTMGCGVTPMDAYRALLVILKQDTVMIWSGEHRAWWRDMGCGYTDDQTQAGLWTRFAAERMTSHCGPEKKIEIRGICA